MHIVWLAWYICGVCLVLALIASAITYAPPGEFLGEVLSAVFGTLALLAGGSAVVLGRLPKTHRIHQSRPLWTGVVAVAVTVTLALVLAA